MGTSIGIVLLGGLLIWMLIDMRQIRNKRFISVDKAAGWSKNKLDVKRARNLIFGLSAIGYVIAAIEWIKPRMPPFTGRLSYVKTILYESFGPNAIPVFWALLASGFLLLALSSKWAREERA